MKKISLVLTGISLVFLSSLFGLLVLWQQHQLSGVSVVFLNVGQGDAILIQDGKTQILIDSGKDDKEYLSELGRYIPFWDRHIEILIPTHPDTDHIGGFDGIARSYSVGKILWTGVESNTETFKKFQEVFEQSVPAENWVKLSQGSIITLPREGKISVLYPQHIYEGVQEDEDTNATSLVLLYEFGETSFLLTGDLPYEERVLSNIPDVSVLKVAHHGSKYSSSAPFLNLVKPEEAIISVGKNNYGHPAPEVLENLQNVGASIFRTDQLGSIKYQCLLEERKCVYR